MQLQFHQILDGIRTGIRFILYFRYLAADTIYKN